MIDINFLEYFTLEFLLRLESNHEIGYKQYLFRSQAHHFFKGRCIDE